MKFKESVLTPLLLLVFCIGMCHTANILFYWGYSGKSHRISVWPLVKKLASSGHNVTFLSPYPHTKPTFHPNITEKLIPKEVLDYSKMDYDPAEIRVTGGAKAVQDMWTDYFEIGVQLCEGLLNNKEIQEWANTASYDLVVVNGLLNDCGFGFAWKFKAQTVMYGTSTMFPWWTDAYGLPEENYPEMFYYHPPNMTFFQEIRNIFSPLYWHAYRQWYFLPKLETILRPLLNITDMPSLLELDQRNSLVLMNTHFSEEFPRSLPPLVIPVGGQHCSENPPPLPDDMEKFIDKWDHGFIYFSFGTYMRLPLLPERLKDVIFTSLKKFPSIGFVMKWNGGPVPDHLPANVFTSEWMPQQSILSHPKIRAFISHGGLLSTQEAVFYAVPMIVFPIFAEQDYNAQRIHSNERGLMLEISDLTSDKLEGAIREIITNKKYKENQIRVSRIFRDRPEKPVDKASWWIEFALRHKNTTFLRPMGVNRTWYQRRMLHIWAFVAVSVALLFSLFFVALKLILSLLFKGSEQKFKRQ